jgi:glycosyltransferase involved in cell wall biosynthesis
VIINGLWNYASFGTWRVLHSLAVPYFVFPHGMLDPWFNRAYPVKGAFKSVFWKLFEHKVLRDARGVLFTCEDERLLASQSFLPYQAREFVVGYGANDVQGNSDDQRAAFFAAVPEARGRKVILFLSRIHQKKGVDILIEAFAANAKECPDYELVIAGPDQEGLKPQLQKRANELGFGDRIHWPGMLAGDAKWGAFRAAEFFVLPSHQENFGVVVAEAMAFSRPVLITNKVNIWREIEADGAGLVVNDDTDALTTGLRTMCLLSETQRQSFQKNARDCFVRRYNIEDNAMRLLGLIESLAKVNKTAA